MDRNQILELQIIDQNIEIIKEFYTISIKGKSEDIFQSIIISAVKNKKLYNAILAQKMVIALSLANLIEKKWPIN